MKARLIKKKFLDVLLTTDEFNNIMWRRANISSIFVFMSFSSRPDQTSLRPGHPTASTGSPPCIWACRQRLQSPWQTVNLLGFGLWWSRGLFRRSCNCLPATPTLASAPQAPAPRLYPCPENRKVLFYFLWKHFKIYFRGDINCSMFLPPSLF